MNDRTKLPKWAQEELRILEMRLDEATTRLNAAADDDQGTHYLFSNWFPELVPIPLVRWERSHPRAIFTDPTIRDSRGFLHAPRFECRYNPEGPVLEVMVDDIQVHPQSSNVIQIRSKEL